MLFPLFSATLQALLQLLEQEGDAEHAPEVLSDVEGGLLRAEIMC